MGTTVIYVQFIRMTTCKGYCVKNKEISTFHIDEYVGLSSKVVRCKAPVKSAPPTTNTQLFTDWIPFLSPNQQCQSI